MKFHNGRELKAADAKFSLEWQLWKDVYSWGKSYGETIVGYQDVIDGKTQELSGVKVIDDYTIEVQLSKPQAVFPALLSYSMWGLIPKEETIQAGKDFGTKVVIGSGPFKFVSWERGQKVIFEKHKDYHRQPLPYLDRIEESLLIQPPTQLLQFEAGQADRIMNDPTGRIGADPDRPEGRRYAARRSDVRRQETAHELQDEAVRQRQGPPGGRTCDRQGQPRQDPERDGIQGRRLLLQGHAPVRPQF